MELQAMRPGDWPAVRVIYEAGIATGNATFETTAPDWPAWDAAHLPGHRLVARVDGRVVGWTTLAPVSDRCAYAGVVGVRERLGRLRGRWRDVVLVERRSPAIT